MFHLTCALAWQLLHISILFATYLCFRVHCIRNTNDLVLRSIVRSIDETYSIDLTCSIHIIQRLALILISGLMLSFVMHAKLLALHILLFILLDVAIVLKLPKSPAKSFCLHMTFRIMMVCVVYLSNLFEEPLARAELQNIPPGAVLQQDTNHAMYF